MRMFAYAVHHASGVVYALELPDSQPVVCGVLYVSGGGC